MVTENCIVCLLPIRPGEEVIDCPKCGGLAHRNEILEWVKTKRKCPFCMREVTIRELVDIAKVSVVGFGGVGKTTLLKLLLDEEVPIRYNPTLMVNIKNLKNVETPIKTIVWDFAGQQGFGRFWNLMIRGSDIIMVVTNSSISNVVRTKKRIMALIQKHSPNARVIAVANKQDLPHSLSPEIVGKLLGVSTYGTVAIDPSSRKVLLKAIQDSFGI
ncbi:MAG: ADP-ribosylation factor-like protein [Candidatus Hodarchaeota archaeon]